MIASPRMRIPDESELPDLIKRLNGENALIELDAKTKFKKQKDYVQVHISQAVPPQAESKPKTILFSENLRGERATLFPKLPVPVRQITNESSDVSRVNSVATSRLSEPEDVLTLGRPSDLEKQTLKVFLPPFDGTFVNVIVDESVTVKVLMKAVMDHAKLKRSEQWCMRWCEDDEGSPDLDLPALDLDQPVTAFNVSELCISSDAVSDSD